MAMIGHETPSMYKRYSIVDEVMLSEGSAKLDAYSKATTPEPPRGRVAKFAGQKTR
jgi:hypothetical protein